MAVELSARGHEVVWHCGPGYRERIEAAGARFVPFEATPDFSRIPVLPDPGTRGLAAGISVLRRLLLDRVRGQVSDYRQILHRFPADLLLVDMCSYGATTLHHLGGPRFATLGINPLVTFDPEIPPFGSRRPPATSAAGRLLNRVLHALTRRSLMAPLTRELQRIRGGLGLPPLPDGRGFEELRLSPWLHLMPTTPAFEYPRRDPPPQVRFVGPLLPSPAERFEPPAWWSELDGRTVVHVTQGTVATAVDDLLRPTLEALADEDLLVVATTPNPGALGALPHNARVHGFLPHSRLLPKTDAMVTNGGYNGVLAALAAGVPLVCAGETEDKPAVAARVAWSGAGLDLATSRPGRRRLRRAVATVLSDPAYREKAKRIRDDFAGHRPAAEAADLLEELARPA